VETIVMRGGTEHSDDQLDPLTDVGDDADLRGSLDALARLAIGELELSAMLTHVAEFAVQAIPGADGAGLTLFHEGQPDTLVASTEFVREVDAIQYGLGEGPCITAAAEGRTVRSDSLGADRSWPRFGPRVSRLGVHSVVSLPLRVPEGVLGAMNIYAHAKNAFDSRAMELGERYAVPAAISAQNARALAQARTLTAQLRTALASRPLIDQAVGIVMSRVGCGPDEAFARLRAMSQTENRKLSVVAEQLVEEAVRRARARHLEH
jgi:transcriptional regulator with GAF, ATPase, and Fis domain